MRRARVLDSTIDVAVDRYNTVAGRSAAVLLREYSTSFGWATRLLAREMRPHIANIYGLVRIADEIVDGPAQWAGLDVAARGELLDRLERDVRDARELGYSSNLIVHAFVNTSAQFGIGDDLTAPFFASMRADLNLVSCTQAEFDRYVYGSAEVIGLMCLKVFLGGEPVSDERRVDLEAGAQRLGAAFQKINFLRDLGDDVRVLGRSYFPGVADGRLDDVTKAAIIASIRDDLRVAERSIRDLPVGARPAVLTALRLFESLTDRLEATPAERLLEHRVRVPNPTKVGIVARAAIEGRRP